LALSPSVPRDTARLRWEEWKDRSQIPDREDRAAMLEALLQQFPNGSLNIYDRDLRYVLVGTCGRDSRQAFGKDPRRCRRHRLLRIASSGASARASHGGVHPHRSRRRVPLSGGRFPSVTVWAILSSRHVRYSASFTPKLSDRIKADGTRIARPSPEAHVAETNDEDDDLTVVPLPGLGRPGRARPYPERP
jgi:hypothetical protein